MQSREFFFVLPLITLLTSCVQVVDDSPDIVNVPPQTYSCVEPRKITVSRGVKAEFDLLLSEVDKSIESGVSVETIAQTLSHGNKNQALAEYYTYVLCLMRYQGGLEGEGGARLIEALSQLMSISITGTSSKSVNMQSESATKTQEELEKLRERVKELETGSIRHVQQGPSSVVQKVSHNPEVVPTAEISKLSDDTKLSSTSLREWEPEVVDLEALVAILRKGNHTPFSVLRDSSCLKRQSVCPLNCRRSCPDDLVETAREAVGGHVLSLKKVFACVSGKRDCGVSTMADERTAVLWGEVGLHYGNASIAYDLALMARRHVNSHCKGLIWSASRERCKDYSVERYQNLLEFSEQKKSHLAAYLLAEEYAGAGGLLKPDCEKADFYWRRYVQIAASTDVEVRPTCAA